MELSADEVIAVIFHEHQRKDMRGKLRGIVHTMGRQKSIDEEKCRREINVKSEKLHFKKQKE